MRVTNPGDEVWLPAVEANVGHLETVEVDAETGASLVEQGWKSARSVAAKKVARKRAKESAQADESTTQAVDEAAPAADDTSGKD